MRNLTWYERAELTRDLFLNSWYHFWADWYELMGYVAYSDDLYEKSLSYINF